MEDQKPFTFDTQFPKKKNVFQSGRKTGYPKFDMKKFVAPCSFPSISINIRKVVVFNDANFQDFSKKLVNMSTKNTRGSYRSRNRFMVTRNLLCRLVKQETALSSTDVSKVVSLVRHQFIFSKAHILN